MSNFAEYELVYDVSSLSQGDVLAALIPSGDPWSDLLVVITADCDLAHNKHGGRVSCVPLVPARFYLREFFLYDRAARRLKMANEKFSGLVRRGQRAAHPDFGKPISDRRAIGWLHESGAETIAQVLKLPDKIHEELIKCASSIDLLQDLDNASYDEVWQRICDASVALGHSVSPENFNKSFQSEISGFLHQLPGDAMFLNAVAPEHESGYVGYLRLIRELSDQQIALKRTGRTSDHSHERISTLRTHYVHKMTQQLGSVFSSIGLPTEYESARLTYCDSLTPVTGVVEIL